MKRKQWLIEWLGELEEARTVKPTEFRSGLGRLCFPAAVLDWLRPLLAPMFSWVVKFGTASCHCEG
eukprot:1637316-Amphidinium_carterae.3